MTKLITLRSNTLRPLVIIALAAVLIPSLAPAGFSDPASGGSSSHRANGVPIGKPGSSIPTELRDAIKNRFGLTNSQTTTKIGFIRRNIKKAIDLVKAENPQVGEAMEDALNSGRLCVDTNPSLFVAAEIKDDANGKPLININISRFSSPFVRCEDMALYRGDMFKLGQTLLHEGIHHLQTALTPQGGSESARHFKARRGKLFACHEIEAENAEEAVASSLLAALNQFINDRTIPAGTPGAAKAIMDALSSDASLTDAQKVQKAKALRASVEVNSEANQARIACEQQKKALFTTFLAHWDLPGTIESQLWNTLQAALKEIEWEKLLREDYDSQKDFIYYTLPPSASLIQSNGDSTTTLFTSLISIQNFMLIGDSTRCIITGPLNALGDGAIMGYTDVDGDGFFEGETEQELIRMDVLNDAGNIVVDPVTGDLVLFNAVTNELYWLLDSTLDGWPDWIDIAGAIDFFRTDILTVEFSADGQFAYGLLESSSASDLLLSFDREIPVSGRLGSEFLIATPYQLGDQARFMPVFASPPNDAGTSLDLDGVRNASVSVHRVDALGASLGIIATAVLDGSGRANAPLSGPIVGGDLLQVRDDTNGINSFPTSVLAVTAAPNGPQLCLGCITELRASPNPFNPRVTIDFEIGGATQVSVAIHDARGRLLRTMEPDSPSTGDLRVRWDGLDERGRPMASGMYFARVSTDRSTAVIKLVLVR